LGVPGFTPQKGQELKRLTKTEEQMKVTWGENGGRGKIFWEQEEFGENWEREICNVGGTGKESFTTVGHLENRLNSSGGRAVNRTLVPALNEGNQEKNYGA